MFLAVIFIAGACKNEEKSSTMENPLLTEFNTPFNVPPFDQIELDDYLPAFQEAIEINKKEIDEIVSNGKEPNFENTILALERAVCNHKDCDRRIRCNLAFQPIFSNHF